MSTIRAKTIHRVVFVVSMILLAALSYGAYMQETRREWAAYQKEFKDIAREKIKSELEKALSNNDQRAMETWHTRLSEVEAFDVRLRQIFLPDANVRDLCTTCHLGVEDPLFVDAPEPFKTHPGRMLDVHRAQRFGCTVCHHGQGVGVTTEAAHGYVETWYRPLLPKEHIEATCIGCHETSYGLEGAERLEQGRLTFAKYGCYGCHNSRGFENLPKFGPTFEGLASKLADERWMLSWLKTPDKMRPTTIMPTFKLSDEEIRDLTAFVLSLKAEKEYPKVNLAAASAQEGERLFTDLGCRACHSSKKDEAPLERRVPLLIDAGTKLNPNWVFEYLRNPKAYNPDTPMPTLDITDNDRLNLTAYLMTLKENADIVQAEQLTTKGASIETGEKIAQLQGCYGCHRVESLEKGPMPGVEVAEVAKKALDELPFGNSNVPMTKWDWIFNKIKTPKIYETWDMPLKMPEYRFEDGELTPLTTYYLFNAQLHLPEKYMAEATWQQRRGQAGEWLVTHYNCRGCHMFEENLKPRIDQFIDLKTYVPPRLVGEGEKVQPQWAFQYLNRPVPMRPWLKMRMPTFSFTYEQIEDAINYFAITAASPENARVPYVILPQKEDIPQIEIEMGEYRLLADKCMQCHPVSLEAGLPEDVKLEDLSINLMLSKSRLRFNWIKNFLRNPDKYAGAGTKMPYVFYTPEGVPRVSDAEMWIDYITKYLMVMEKIPEAPPEEEKKPEEEVDWTQMSY
ncbi:MAG: hypothetical protein Kow0099_37140 [Candidatus Abyssubacteria bacterium]